MLSFFSKKKQSPDSHPEEIIKGPESNGDDFIIIDDHQPNIPPALQSTGISMPMMPACPYPPAGFGQQMGHLYISASSQNPTSYLLDIPFNFAPQLNTKNNFEITQMEVDGILALMTKQMQIEIDYDFNLERAILSDCY